jgi:hypothetical protein
MSSTKRPSTSAAATELYLGATTVRAAFYRELFGSQTPAVRRHVERHYRRLRVLVAGDMYAYQPHKDTEAGVEAATSASGSILCEELADLGMRELKSHSCAILFL